VVLWRERLPCLLLLRVLPVRVRGSLLCSVPVAVPGVVTS